VKADLFGGVVFINRLHEFVDGLENDFELFVVFFLEGFKFAGEINVRAEHLPEADESAHDLNIDLNRARAVEQAGKHGHTLLSEGDDVFRELQAFSGYPNLGDPRDFLTGEDEHKVLGKTLYIALHRPIYNASFNTVELSQVLIQKHLLSAQEKDTRINLLHGNRGQTFRGKRGGGFGGGYHKSRYDSGWFGKLEVTNYDLDKSLI